MNIIGNVIRGEKQRLQQLPSDKERTVLDQLDSLRTKFLFIFASRCA